MVGDWRGTRRGKDRFGARFKDGARLFGRQNQNGIVDGGPGDREGKGVMGLVGASEGGIITM